MFTCLVCCKLFVFHFVQTARLMDDCFCSGGFFGVVVCSAFNFYRVDGGSLYWEESSCYFLEQVFFPEIIDIYFFR